MTIFLGADHAGYKLKESLKKFLSGKGYEIKDCGAFSYNEQDDYPDFIRPVAEKVAKNPNEDRGIVLGGSGQGEAMVANRVKGVRCAVFYGPVTAKEPIDIEGDKSNDPYEIVKLERMHNNTNILSLGARFLSEEEAKEAVMLWLTTPFSGEERHARRIQKF